LGRIGRIAPDDLPHEALAKQGAFRQLSSMPMEMNRRQFIAMSGVVVPGTVLAGLGARAVLGAVADAAGGAGGAPWHQRIKRIGQLNFNERDPLELDVEAWADYWASLKVDAVLVSVTGIIASTRPRSPSTGAASFSGTRTSSAPAQRPRRSGGCG
jgi:hypothetical protein